MTRRWLGFRRSTLALVVVFAAQIASCAWSPWLVLRPAGKLSDLCTSSLQPPPGEHNVWCVNEGPAGVGASGWLWLVVLYYVVSGLAIWSLPFIALARRFQDARAPRVEAPAPDAALPRGAGGARGRSPRPWSPADDAPLDSTPGRHRS